MEGLGSTRLGRASARYSSTSVFNGPVRKWKKKWVHVSPSSTVKHSQSNGNNSNVINSSTSSILLCRWTPLSSTDSGSFATSSAVDGEEDEQPPKRKFRYTPVAVLEEERKRAAVKQVENEVKTDENETKQYPVCLKSKSPNELNINNDFKEETQDLSVGNLDLGLCLKGPDDGQNAVSENEGVAKDASSVEFWTMG